MEMAPLQSNPKMEGSRTNKCDEKDHALNSATFDTSIPLHFSLTLDNKCPCFLFLHKPVQVGFLPPATDNALNNTLSKGNVYSVLYRNSDTPCSYSEKYMSIVKNLSTSLYQYGKYISVL